MARSKTEWETKFRQWAEGPGDTESTKCENAETMIRKAISASPDLRNLDIEVFSQGSFKNVTNIPQESDVDVSVCLKGSFYYQIPNGKTPEQYGLTNPTSYTYTEYRSAVIKAIRDYFPAGDTSVGKKAVHIKSNSYRVESDVVPNWLFKRFNDNGSITEGVKFYSADNKEIVNYPKQHTLEGIGKNSRTKKRFKRLVRILKSLQVELIDQHFRNERLPSFFIESLVYNVPHEQFGHESYFEDVQEVLRYLYLNTKENSDTSNWVEVNHCKWLFRSQPWTKAQANAFALSAWQYVGLFK